MIFPRNTFVYIAISLSGQTLGCPQYSAVAQAHHASEILHAARRLFRPCQRPVSAADHHTASANARLGSRLSRPYPELQRSRRGSLIRHEPPLGYDRQYYEVSLEWPRPLTHVFDSWGRAASALRGPAGETSKVRRTSPGARTSSLTARGKKSRLAWASLGSLA